MRGSGEGSCEGEWRGGVVRGSGEGSGEGGWRGGVARGSGAIYYFVDSVFHVQYDLNTYPLIRITVYFDLFFDKLRHLLFMFKSAFVSMLKADIYNI